MALTASALQSLTQGTEADAWRVIIDHAVGIASKPLAAGNAPSEVVRRDREIGDDVSVCVAHRCQHPRIEMDAVIGEDSISACHVDRRCPIGADGDRRRTPCFRNTGGSGKRGHIIEAHHLRESDRGDVE